MMEHACSIFLNYVYYLIDETKQISVLFLNRAKVVD